MFKRDSSDRSTSYSAAKITAIVVFVLALRAATQLRGVRGAVLVGAAVFTVLIVFESDVVVAAIRNARRTK